MLHYLFHASTVPWQDQLLYAGLIVAIIALVFGGLWWRKRAARPRQGDFAALAEQGNVAQALAAQAAASPLQDAAEAWQQTQHTLEHAKSGVQRVLALVLALLSGLLCAISVSAVIGYAWKFPAVDWGLLAFYAVLGAVCAWFTRAQWRDFRGRK